MLPPSPKPFRPLLSFLPLFHTDAPLQNRKSRPLPPFGVDCEFSLEPLARTAKYPVNTGEYDVEQTPGVKRASAQRNGLANDEPSDPIEKAVSRCGLPIVNFERFLILCSCSPSQDRNSTSLGIVIMNKTSLSTPHLIDEHAE